MLISTEIFSWRGMGSDEKTITMLKDSGFTAYDYSMVEVKGVANLGFELLLSEDYLERAQALRAYADSIGLPCNQTHAPFSTAKKGNEEYNRLSKERILRALEISGILGAKYCVVHPCNDYTPEENAELYRAFIPTAKRAGVKIATENMWNCIGWGTPEFRATPAACSSHENFKRHMELLTALDADVFGACVDIGHSEMKGLDTSAVQMLETLGDYVACIHLHDVDLVHDNHHLPFACQIEYAPIIEAFRKIGYKGDITLESSTFSKNLPVELLPAAARYAAAVAQYFKDKIEDIPPKRADDLFRR